MVQVKMPPARAELTSSFSITDTANEVVCPLPNQDGSNCRKRCIGEKRYRSMQEHIRRAHPEYYIPKLPATEASFHHMISSSPRKRPDPEENSAVAAQGFRSQHSHYDGSAPVTPRHSDEYSTTPGGAALGTASAAAVLAELHGVKSERDVDMDGQGYISDHDRRIPRSSIELPPIHQLPNNDITSDPYSRRDLFPPMLSGSPPGRSSTLPPLHQATGPSRPRTHSINKRGRESQHKKKNSRGSAADWLRRVQNDGRKAMSAEPSADFGKRWEDLIDAADQAASAAGDVDEDRTPMPQSPVSIQRGSMPPFSGAQIHTSNYQASPLQQALTPPSNTTDTSEPFPSVESNESGSNFHMGAHGLTDSSPTYSSHNIQIYCAACRSISSLKNSYACTECICGFCSTCVEVMMAEQGARRKCPRCATIGGRFKPFQLEIR